MEATNSEAPVTMSTTYVAPTNGVVDVTIRIGASVPTSAATAATTAADPSSTT